VRRDLVGGHRSVPPLDQLAAAALISLALTVLAAVRRRRRELGLLKTLGMTKRQVRAVIGWQTTVILTVAALAGIPLGLAAGRWAWTGFADSLGVAPAPQVPVLWQVIGFAVLLGAGNLLALVPAEIAARIRPAATLRTE
jgi:ABC-type antimicrobial peptide transport system permease subunit